MREFVNLRPNHPSDCNISVDTIVDGKSNENRMAAELSGVEKEDVDVVLEDEGVMIDATRDQIKLHTIVALPQNANRDSIRTSYRNGVLEMVFNIENKLGGKTVRVD